MYLIMSNLQNFNHIVKFIFRLLPSFVSLVFCKKKWQPYGYHFYSLLVYGKYSLLLIYSIIIICVDKRIGICLKP